MTGLKLIIYLLFLLFSIRSESAIYIELLNDILFHAYLFSGIKLDLFSTLKRSFLDFLNKSIDKSEEKRTTHFQSKWIIIIFSLFQK